MLPGDKIHTALRGQRLIPRYLDERDHPWLRALLDEYARFAGRPRRELDERLREPLPVPCPDDKLAQARWVLDRACRDRTRAPVRPRKARAALFSEAARGAPRDRAIACAARALETDAQTLLECLFADLPGERRLCSPPQELSPTALALQANLAHVQTLLARATRVEIRALGGARDLVRHAQLRGLLGTVRRAEDGRQYVLELSGPLLLFRRTLVYGRALASLVPRLAWCEQFRMEAECELGDTRRVVDIRSGDPILPSRPPQRFDSKVEQRFARDFARAAPDWQLVREPEPVEADGTLIFPDFAIEHRGDPRNRWLLEIMGFWTPEYVARKLARLRAAGLERLVLCIDEERDCGSEELPPAARVVRYRRRIDAEKVRSIVEGRGSSSNSRVHASARSRDANHNKAQAIQDVSESISLASATASAWETP